MREQGTGYNVLGVAGGGEYIRVLGAREGIDAAACAG